MAPALKQRKVVVKNYFVAEFEFKSNVHNLSPGPSRIIVQKKNLEI